MKLRKIFENQELYTRTCLLDELQIQRFAQTARTRIHGVMVQINNIFGLKIVLIV